MKVAILGASGFVGVRAFEYLTLSGRADVRGITRSHCGLARLARFAADWRLADALNEEQLVAAFSGCDYVFHCVMGDNATIAKCAAPAYRAANRSGIKKIVFISSAAIYGGSQLSIVDDATEPPESQAGEITYASAKLAAENEFRELSGSGGVGVVILRPSIIIGPRSFWIADTAKRMFLGMAALANGGNGYCNLVYVDNLIDAALLVCERDEATGETFLVSDDTVTWGDYYRRLAALLGVAPATIPSIPYTPPPKPFKLTGFRSTAVYQFISKSTPKALKRIVHRTIWTPPPLPLVVPADPCASTLESYLAELHTTTWRLSPDKIRRLGYHPAVTLEEGLRRSVAWLQFAGLA